MLYFIIHQDAPDQLSRVFWVNYLKDQTLHYYTVFIINCIRSITCKRHSVFVIHIAASSQLHGGVEDHYLQMTLPQINHYKWSCSGQLPEECRSITCKNYSQHTSNHLHKKTWNCFQVAVNYHCTQTTMFAHSNFGRGGREKFSL